ncbi:MAG: hypothetical protein JW716_01525 [Candidatus Aenigmarchaeota archaeon]|nr:hypothetical protein [Candidatus Aenigmarchaeota archaeon]
MVLDRDTIKKITDFVYTKPRTIQEISVLLDVNWRTAERYVERISEETGSISARTFRKGTRGALKIVFWNNLERIHSSELQERIFRRIESGGKKTDFSPFDIYQYISDDKRRAVLYQTKRGSEKERIKDYLRTTRNQILSFSGSVSWINSKEKDEKLIDVVRAMAENNISVKIISRVTVDSMKNVRSLLAINDEIGKKVIEIRHAKQPLRGFVIDSDIARFREVINPFEIEDSEISKDLLLFYEIYDKEWIEWLQKIFWHIFRTAIPAEKRIKDLDSIRNIYTV